MKKTGKITRADVKAIRTDLTADEITAILELHHEAVTEYETDIANYQTNYVAKSELETLKTEIAELKKTQGSSEEKTELENLRKYKTETEAKESNVKKTEAIKKGLVAMNAHPDVIDLLKDKFDLSKIELDDKGEIKGFEEVAKPIKEQFGKFFATEETIGAKPGEGAKPGGGEKTGDPFASAREKYKENLKKE